MWNWLCTRFDVFDKNNLRGVVSIVAWFCGFKREWVEREWGEPAEKSRVFL